MAGPAGANLTATGNRAGWSPTVVNLLVLIALEIGAYVLLRWTFRTAHGG